MTIGEFSRLSGVSIRMLRHYDSLGLLSPAAVTEAGYRLYDETSAERLRSVLLLLELRFPLKEIARILNGPGFDPRKALRDQLELLRIRRDRLDAIIGLAESILEKGENTMDLSAFSTDEYDRYAAEVKRRWGDTAAYAEYEARGNGGDPSDALKELFKEFGALRNGDPDGEAAQAAVRALQGFITANYYTCTDEILAGLGEMYCADERFRKNIDAAGGEGTAEFIRDAIRMKTERER